MQKEALKIAVNHFLPANQGDFLKDVQRKRSATLLDIWSAAISNQRALVLMPVQEIVGFSNLKKDVIPSRSKEDSFAIAMMRHGYLKVTIVLGVSTAPPSLHTVAQYNEAFGKRAFPVFLLILSLVRFVLRICMPDDSAVPD